MYKVFLKPGADPRPEDLSYLPPSMLVHDVGHLIHKRMQELEQASGIKSGYRMIIFHLAHQDGVLQHELAEKVKIRASTVSATLANMERDGLIRRETQEDKRCVRVWLTEQGRALDTQIRSCIERVDDALMELLTDGERAELSRILLKMRTLLRERSFQ